MIIEEPEPEIQKPEIDLEKQRQERLARWASIKQAKSEPTPTIQPDTPMVFEPEPTPHLDSEKNKTENLTATNLLGQQTQLESATNALDEANQVNKENSHDSSIDMFDSDSDVEFDQVPVFKHGHVRNITGSSVDVEGYYRPQLGEILNNRYRVFGYFGKGTFGSVLKATDLTNNETVAIKLLRNNDHMTRTGLGEMKILEILTASDPEMKANTVRLLSTFVEREHLCLVFEAMDINLRQLIKMYGRDKGLGIEAVRAVGFKLLKALYHMKKNGVVHADFKPDNLLISKDRSEVKVGDMGSGFLTTEEFLPTPHLVSGYYRAPEIILGMSYGPALDMFAFGCCLYEFATGKLLFKSSTLNEHLKMIMDITGKFPKKMINMGVFRSEYFSDDFGFLRVVTDGGTNMPIVRKEHVGKPSRSISKEIWNSYKSSEQSDEEVVLLADLINKCLVADPDRRITPELALRHPFFFYNPDSAKKESNSTTKSESCN